jgi:hypothetical protein
VPTPDFPIHPNQSARFTAASSLRVREDVFYTNAKGEENEGIRKRNDQALEKLQETLRKVLEPEEVTLYVARAREKLSTLEQLLLGWHAIFASDSLLLVFTNRRLLLFHVKGNGEWCRGTRVVRWGDIQEAKVKGLGGKMIFLTYRNGIKESFWQLRGDDGKKAELLVQTLLPAATGESSSAQGAVCLCPSCFKPLTPEVFECPQCHQVFKNTSALTRRGWLIPGGAYFYTGRLFLGITGLISEVIFLVLAAAFLLMAMAGPGATTDPQNPPPTSGEALVFAAIMLGFFALLKLVGLKNGRRAVERFIPASS